MLKQTQTQKLQQNLSPLQIQTIKLIELPSLEVEERIKNELEDNPFLEKVEEEEDKAIENSDTQENAQNSSSYIPVYRTSPLSPSPIISNDQDSRQDFRHDLKVQYGCLNKSEEEILIANYVIDEINDSGYLRPSADSIANFLETQEILRTTPEKVQSVIYQIQALEPAGIAAANLQECLLLQLERKEQTIAVKNAQIIIRDHLKDFADKHFDKIKKKLNISQEELKEINDIIVRLNPYPGGETDSPFSNKSQQISPDFELKMEDGKPLISLTRFSIPDIRLSQKGINKISSNSKLVNDKEFNSYMKQKYTSAKWFIDALKQRQNTLMKTMEAIVNFQQEYFKGGDRHLLKPMVLNDIAEVTGLDVSTISRVASSKFIDTHFGIISLKSLFSESLTNAKGEKVSTAAIKTALLECIDHEDKNNPLTDEELVDELTKRGFKVSRRTISKYREQLHINIARLRKTL